MDNNQNNVFGQSYVQKPPAKINIIEIIAVSCAGVGLLMVILGTIFTCTCTAKKVLKEGFSETSPVFIVTIFGVIFSIAAVVLAIVAIKQKNAVVKAGKLSRISFVIGCLATLVGLMPLFTICGYNCSLKSELKSANTNKNTGTNDYNYSNWFN